MVRRPCDTWRGMSRPRSMYRWTEWPTLTYHAAVRTAFPEVIFCENKRLDQIVAITKRLHAHTALALGTRCPAEFFPALKKTFPRGHFVPEARSFRIGRPLAKIRGASAGIISAGTTDIPVCEEAALVLESLGVATHRIYDVGVAGIHRLFAKDALIRRCDVLIAVAGMEGALPSVLAGLYPSRSSPSRRATATEPRSEASRRCWACSPAARPACRSSISTTASVPRGQRSRF